MRKGGGMKEETGQEGQREGGEGEREGERNYFTVMGCKVF